MSYLQLLPTDLIKEISRYLTEVETKYILQIRGYIDLELIFAYMDKDDNIACYACKRHDRHYNMKIMEGNLYCGGCVNKLKFCNYCIGIALQTNICQHASCENVYCEKHAFLGKKCILCDKYFCMMHYKISIDKHMMHNVYFCEECYNKNKIDNY